MNRTSPSLPLLSLLLPTLALAGCPTSMGADTGVDVSAPIDTGVDTGSAVVDTGVDATISMTDAGRDGGMPSDAPLLPPSDTGDPFGDTGTVGHPDWVPVDVLTDGTTCPAFTACGGDEVGTWDVTGGCFEVPIPMDLMRCPGATIDATGRARGRVTFTGTVAVRTAQSEVVADIFVPGLCATFAGGCAVIEGAIQMRVPDSACVESADGSCNCQTRQAFLIDDADAYTIMGNEIVSTSSGKRWEYCVAGGTLTYTDVSPMGMVEPGIIELGRVP